MAFLKHLHDCLIGSPDIFTDYRVAGQCSGIFREVSEDESRKHDKEQNGKHQYTADGCSSFRKGAPVPEYCTDDSKRTAHQGCFWHVTYAPFAVGLAAVSGQWIHCSYFAAAGSIWCFFDRILCILLVPGGTIHGLYRRVGALSRSCILVGMVQGKIPVSGASGFGTGDPSATDFYIIIGRTAARIDAI